MGSDYMKTNFEVRSDVTYITIMQPSTQNIDKFAFVLVDQLKYLIQLPL